MRCVNLQGTRIVPKAFILFGKDKDVYKKDEDV